MLILNISKADIERLNYERYNNPSVLIQKRCHLLYLKGTLDLNHGALAKIVDIHINTVGSYIKLYNRAGLSGVLRTGYGTNTTQLDLHKESLLDYFEKQPPHSVNEARQVIKQRTGIQRSPTQVRVWLKKQGLKYRKTAQIPAKAAPDKQAEFLEQTLNPLIQQAENGQIHLLFMDAAHFVMGVFLCSLWSLKRIFVKSSAGRKRYNVLGAVNALTKQIHTFTNTKYINANCICDFFEQLRNYYNDAKPIYIVLDNARYQKCQLVKYIAWQFNIQLVYLPPYSPNLNIIERFWKWTKKQALYAKFYEDFQAFKTAIDNAVIDANNHKKKEVKSLLNLKFQTF